MSQLELFDEEGEDTECFSLACYLCDAGQGVDTFEQAIDEGWSGIEHCPDLAWANYIGTCPDCMNDEEREALEILKQMAKRKGR